MLIHSKLKRVAFSISVLITISLFSESQKIEGQSMSLGEQQNVTQIPIAPPMNLTQQQNFTQPTSLPDFRCFLSANQPADPVEMKTSIIPSNLPVPFFVTKFYLYKSFDCRSDIVAIPPPYKRDIVLVHHLVKTLSGQIVQSPRGVVYCDFSDETNKGEVIGCTGRGVPGTVNQTLTDCTELPVEHPIDLNPLDHHQQNEFPGHIFAQTHEYTCLFNNADKLKTVTIFNTNSQSLSFTCIFDIANGTADACQGKPVPSL